MAFSSLCCEAKVLAEMNGKGNVQCYGAGLFNW